MYPSSQDKLRDNELATVGWRVLRFTTVDICERPETYCLPKVVENINRLDGLEEGKLVGRRFELDGPRGYQQMQFDDVR